MRAWDRMQEAVATTQRPFIFGIHADGHLELLRAW